MELQALLVLCGVGVVVVAVLLLMGLFSASGTSYEEAIAQQRRATTELLALAENKNKPKKNNKKAIKKQARKEKNKENAVTTGSEVDSEAPAESGLDEDTVPPAKPHVEFCPPVVVDVPRDTLPNVKIRKRGKDPKVKPILINKEDPSCISDPSTPPSPTGSVSNHFEEIHPKDEFELLHSSLAAEKTPEKKEEVVEKKEKPAKAAKAGKGKQPAPEPAKEERERHNSGEAPKEQRKGNKKADKKQVEEEVKAEVIPPLNVPQPSELTTDKLLKQAQALAAPAPTAAVAPAPAPAHAPAPAGKNKKKKAEPNVLSLMAAGDGGGVNVGELVRVVREAALSRTEIQILTDALLNKHHDPLPQHSEWTEGPNDPMQKLKKQLADKEKVLADEVEASQALHAKLKELRATLNAERGRVTATTRAHEQAAEAARAEIHTHQTRVKRLAEDNHQLQQENRLLQSKLAAEGEFQQQRAQMEMHIQQLSEAEASLVAQLQGLQSELAARALEVAGARCDAGAARDAAIMAQQHAAELAQQLEQLSHDHTRAMQERQAAIADLQNNVQRLMSRAQFAEGNLDKQKEEMDAQVKQLTSELASLREQLAAREAELAEAKQMKVAAPAQNGLPNDQNKSAELAKVESVVEALRSSLSAEQRANKEQKDALTQLQDQLRSYQEKNNELRTKNWKVMEALQTAEKALQAKSANAPAQDPREAVSAASAAAYAEACGALRGALPGAAPSGVAGKAWLLQFADNLKKELQKAASVPAPVPAAAPAPAEARVAELRAHNDHLQALVDKYKKIIDDTEGVLSQLQANVTREEASWARQLAEKQHELDSLRQHTLTQMQKKIDSLQAELQQKQAANHNHSFADSERLTEERLLTAGLSEKYKTDVCNGPLQVGLEEK
ncbi:ribosome-binding protein 1 isoform X1 [Leguminivora glycinivorella]|uniref:ribosome-binding protein 1 isoform X1 n=1 Tax=Leguminivora glycinivorella TaxID=1035111 RepID=UPI00200D1B68|nr:ribosome-binding protein 1 isoform X1 [Leguminivora glycinivorella]XP_047994084.1 ribosome-binding protein 1 isoform X1 [Leguminivora glycinivorella]XP_047994085.1 ribosome-binding protein 1 isoform X1 [Leguminivora glycinivorella]XP_047994086.1 ribosome-binding protein 1 isoform X1 [Leguminivora glycinivorella]XP_047994087.1 ribosome-binding protein 1 isoform X1 [Leguminivora glycinivorella]